jgi:hypothetical protein
MRSLSIANRADQPKLSVHLQSLSIALTVTRYSKKTC